MTDCKQLAEEARQGSREAFAGLYEAVYRDLYRFALYVLKNPEDAQDAVAETVADAYASIGKLRDSGAFKGWIFKILSNKCKRRLKEYTRKTEPLKEEEGSSQGDMDRDMQVREAFYSLDDEERFIVAMQVFGGYKSKEIGLILHKNHNTVRSRLDRALKKMEQLLQ